MDPIDLLEGVSGGAESPLIVKSENDAAIPPFDEDFVDDTDSEDSDEEDHDLDKITNEEIAELLHESNQEVAPASATEENPEENLPGVDDVGDNDSVDPNCAPPGVEEDDDYPPPLE